MPLKITPSKRPVPVAKRSSLRQKSYEVDPIRGPKIYSSRGLLEPIRPPHLSDEEAAAIQSSQIPSENAPLLFSDPVQSPPEVA
jgi:hypothetical protein